MRRRWRSLVVGILSGRLCRLPRACRLRRRFSSSSALGVGIGADLDLGAVVEAVAAGGDDDVGWVQDR